VKQLIDTKHLRPMPEELRRRYLAEGWWTDLTLGRTMLNWLAATPDTPFRVWSKTRPAVTTFGEIHDLVLRLAGSLTARGIGPGDTVCTFVPNSIEAAVALIAVPAVGATAVPVAPYYGMHELRHILRVSNARLLITTEGPKRDRLAAIAGMRSSLPSLENVLVFACPALEGSEPFEPLLQHAKLEALPDVDPDSPAAIAFTSGTTSSPKGVVHSHRTLGAEIVFHIAGAMPRPQRAVIVGGPISHVTGMLAGLYQPAARSQSVNLVEGWDAGMVLEAMKKCGLSAGNCAPIFITSLMDHPDATPEVLAQMETIGLGGASVPLEFCERLEAAGVRGVRIYGSTEHPTVTMSRTEDPASIRHRTDGRPLIGVEIRIVDENWADLPPGSAGNILTRGPDLFAGYLEPAMNRDAFDAEGWFDTGDIGIMNEHGCLTLTDRRKDIIVRNGVKVSAVEVEDFLLSHPALTEVAVVAVLDKRTGERGHAFLRLRPGATAPTMAELQAHLDRSGLARPKWPESFEVVDDFPRTVSGKIKKFELRQQMKGTAGG
jgi:acyl-CoA synthetase